ncbi:MAG: P1 family peptidase, partial [Gemmatimonadota bacterium]
TGTRAFGWKGGIGTSSRKLPDRAGGYTVGVLVQTNFGGVLSINGAPVGRELAALQPRHPEGESSAQRPHHADRETPASPLRRPGETGGQGASMSALVQPGSPSPGRGRGGLSDPFDGDGSIMMVVATDAPLDARNLARLARRALAGLARTGSTMSNGSGDYVIAFSTADSVRRTGDEVRTIEDLPNDRMSRLFMAAAEATEEAIYNSLFKATTVHGDRGTVEALPLKETLDILRRYNALHWSERLPRR